MTTDIRRFGYYTPNPDGTIDFVVHDIVASRKNLIEFQEVISVIFNLQPIIFAFNVVERNYQELTDSIQEHCSQLNNSLTTSAKPISFIMDGKILTVQKISNFLSSTSAFLDQTKMQLRRVHGKDSPELNSWDKKRKNLHAASFSYRFLYELRHFSQHRSLPFSSFNIAGRRSSENAPMIFRAKALILRDGLLEDGWNWKKIQIEIQHQPSEFDLLPLITEYLHSLRQLCLEAVELQSVRLAECAHYFVVMRRVLKIPIDAVPVIFIGESISKEIPPSRQELIPMEQLGYLLREYDKLLNACKT